MGSSLHSDLITYCKLAVSLLSMQLKEIMIKDWLTLHQDNVSMNGATCIPADGCFSKLTL